MTAFEALVIISGVTTQLTAARGSLSVGSGITTDAGNLAISSAGGTTTLGDAAVSFSGTPTFAAGMLASGATASDLSGSSGAFKTPTGAVTVGPGAVTVSGAATFTAAGTAFSVNNNALVSGNLSVTGTLTAGSFLLGGLTSSGFTTTAMTGGAGQAGYVSGASTFTPTDSAAIAKSRLGGVYQGTSGQIQTDGVIAAALMTTAGGSPGNGAPVWLAAASDDSNTGAGKFTATAPTTGVLAEVGICLDNANYAGAKTAKILLQVKSPV